MIERRGRVDVIRPDLAVTGTYHVVVDDVGTPPTAWGIARIDDAHLLEKALSVERILFCFDGHAELEVEITFYVPGASLIAFTCHDVTALVASTA